MTLKEVPCYCQEIRTFCAWPNNKISNFQILHFIDSCRHCDIFKLGVADTAGVISRANNHFLFDLDYWLVFLPQLKVSLFQVN